MLTQSPPRVELLRNAPNPGEHPTLGVAAPPIARPPDDVCSDEAATSVRPPLDAPPAEIPRATPPPVASR